MLNNTMELLQLILGQLNQVLDRNQHLEQRVEHLKDQLDVLCERLDGEKVDFYPIGGKDKAAKILGIQPDSVRNYHRYWKKGLHYTKPSPGKTVYNLTLIKDWQLNRDNPGLHARAVEAYAQHDHKLRKRA
jgi:hypothetical protein